MTTALDTLHNWLAPLNLSPTARDATIAAALAVVARPLYAGPMPATYITGPAGAGKTLLAEQLASLAGTTQAWATNEVRPLLTIIRREHAAVAVVDNLDRAPRMSAADDLCDCIETTEARTLGSAHTTPARTSWIITSRTPPPTADLARRCILIDLTGATPAPLAPIDRRALLGALYTLLGAALPIAADPPPPVGGPCDQWFAILAAAGIPTTLASQVTP